jgi:hypothetical protein
VLKSLSRRAVRLLTTIVLAGTVAGVQLAAAPTAGAAPAATKAGSGTGFTVPFSGPSRYEDLAPTQATDPSQINQPLGPQRTEEIAKKLRLHRADALTHEQFLLFITGGGKGGTQDAAKLVDASVAILTNTTGRPLYSNVNGVLTPSVLGSYGLMVNEEGLLQSPANAKAPTRQINTLLAPGGYLDTWMRANGATRSLAMLYRSPYLIEAAYGYVAQQISGDAQLVPNVKSGVRTTVGMSMAPALWLVNFILIYTLNPDLAAYMPAYWTPIPENVVAAIRTSQCGQVPYADYRSSFPQS